MHARSDVCEWGVLQHWRDRLWRALLSSRQHVSAGETAGARWGGTGRGPEGLC
jgi:hypothetical protein